MIKFERAVTYTGDCKHDKTGDLKRKDYSNGTHYCPACGASKFGDEWRVFPSEKRKGA